MDSSPNHSPELPLPEVPAAGSGEAQPIPSIEKKAGAIEGPASSPLSTSAQQAVIQDQAQSGAQLLVGAPVQPQLSATTAALGADDVDIIEKEWVTRAKSIIEKTRLDPHVQSKELSKFKAEYLKQRFQKDIKVTDDKQ